MVDTKDMTAEERAAFWRQTFLDVLREDPDLLEQAGEALLAVTDAVKHGGKGKVNLAIEVKNTKSQGFSDIVFLSGKVTHTVPVAPTEDNLFYAVDGGLSRRDPRQPDLPMFKQVARDESGTEGAEEAAAQ